MSKFVHITGEGVVKPCNAKTPENCPFGVDCHFPSDASNLAYNYADEYNEAKSRLSEDLFFLNETSQAKKRVLKEFLGEGNFEVIMHVAKQNGVDNQTIPIGITKFSTGFKNKPYPDDFVSIEVNLPNKEKRYVWVKRMNYDKANQIKHSKRSGVDVREVTVYDALQNGEVIFTGSYQECLELIGTNRGNGFELVGDVGIVPHV